MAFSPNPLVVGNWKMNGVAATLSEVAAMAQGVAAGQVGEAQCVICPPATLIGRAVETAAGRLAIGAQDCAPKQSGAHTGDIAAEMLRDAGAILVILGHSERRADHGESDALVRSKAEAARRAGLLAIVCVGETRAERDAGRAAEVVDAQLAGSLPPDAAAGSIVVAYEPVWAIGTGLIPTVEDVAEMHAFIRRRLVDLLVGEGAAVRILYGGSVKPDNAAVLMGIRNVDGALIGGASLKAIDFLSIAAVYR